MKIFLGDSGYPLLPFLMTPYVGNNLNLDQTIFNEIIVSTRSLVERTIGLLKGRFRCILGERQLRYNSTKVSKIIYTCATLHNFLLLNGFDMFHDIDDNHLRFINNNQVPNIAPNLNLVANRVTGEYRRNEFARYLAGQMRNNWKKNNWDLFHCFVTSHIYLLKLNFKLGYMRSLLIWL